MLVDLSQGFIQADLPKGGKTIYITPPQGWEEDPDTVYEVKKPLYGMSHSVRYLHKTWSQWLKSEGFESVGYEKSMWVKRDGDQQIMICTHVDDSFVTVSNEDTLINFRNRMISSYGGRFDGVLPTWMQKNMWVWNGSEMSKATRTSFINRCFVKNC